MIAIPKLVYAIEILYGFQKLFVLYESDGTILIL